MRGTRTSDRDERNRGQAYTLEGFAAAAVVLFALLFAMQSLVITPGTGGAVDRTAQAQMQQETQDALIVAAHANESERGNLSELVRYWADDGQITQEAYETTTLGHTLERHVADPAYPDGYRVEFTYLNESSSDNIWTEPIAGSDITDSEAVTASYTIPVFEDEHTVEYDDEFEETSDTISDDPLPADGEDPVHNMVEVRVTVW